MACCVDLDQVYLTHIPATRMGKRDDRLAVKIGDQMGSLTGLAGIARVQIESRKGLAFIDHADRQTVPRLQPIRVL